MQIETYSFLQEFRRWLENVVEALIFAGLFFLPWHNEALIRSSFLAENPYGRLFFEGAFAVWLLAKIAYGEAPRLTAPFWALAVFAGWAWNRVLFLPAPESVDFGIWKLAAGGALLFLFASDFYRDADRRERLIRFYLGWMALAGVSGIWQMLSPRGVDFLAGRPDLLGRLVRMNGPFGSPNALASFLIPALILSFERWIPDRLSRRTLPQIALSILLGVCLVATLSRAAFLALWLTLCGYALFRNRRALGALVLLPAAWLVLSPSLRQNFILSFLESDVTTAYRFQAWGTAARTLLEHPWGVGFRAFAATLRPLSPDAAGVWPSCHNSYLQIGAETGWIGLALFSAAVALVLRPRTRRSRHGTGLYLGLSALALHAFFDADFGRFKIVSLFWVLAGLLESSSLDRKAFSAPTAKTGLVLSAGGLIAFLLACIAPFACPTLNSLLLDQASYGVLWLMAACWASAAWRALGLTPEASVPARLKRLLPGAAMALSLAALVFACVPPRMRVLSDEAVLVLTSQAMAARHSVLLAVDGYFTGGTLTPMALLRPIRPLLFPYLVHLLHLLGGYRLENAFVLNFMVLAGALLLVFEWTRRTTRSFGWALAAAAALLAQPVVLLSSASAGFEMLYLLLILASLAAAKRYLDAPQEEPRLRFLWMTLLLLSQTRYEALVFFLCAAAALAAFRRLPLSHLSKSPVYAATPFLLLPWIWSRMFFWAYRPPTVPLTAPLYSMGAFKAHMAEFFAMLGDWSRVWPYNPPVCMLGLAGLAAAVYAASRRRPPVSTAAKILVWGFAAPLMLVSAGLCAYTESSLYLPQSSRYFIPIGTALSFACVFFLWKCLGPRRGAAAASIMAALALGFVRPALHPDFWTSNRAWVEYRFAREYRERFLAGVEVAWLSRRPETHLAHGESASRPGSPAFYFAFPITTEGKKARLLAVQEIRDGEVTADSALPSPWKTALRAHLQTDARGSLKIVEVSRS